MRKGYLSAAKAGVVALAALSLGAGTASASSQDTVYRHLENAHGKCLSVYTGSTANNAAVLQYTCDAAPDEQYWALTKNSWSTVVNYKSGKCLSLADNGSTANNTAIIQYTCNGQPEQFWLLDAYGELVNFKDSTKCLSIGDNGSTANNTPAVLYTCNGGLEQTWGWL